MKTFTTTLEMGDRGPEVIELQSLLLMRGDASSEGERAHFIDGHFGTRTQLVVRWFQQIHKLTPDGVVGPQTWNKLAGSIEWPTQSPGVFLRQGNTGAHALQNRLTAIGLYRGEIDGEFGPLTHTAVVELQKRLRRGNQVGVVGPLTFGAIAFRREAVTVA